MYICTDASIDRSNSNTHACEHTPMYNVSLHTLIKLICAYHESR